MEDLIKAYRSFEPEKRISAIKQEVDFELDLLYQAITQECEYRKDQSKSRLKQLHREMMILEII